jgi:hypothetical protein
MAPNQKIAETKLSAIYPNFGVDAKVYLALSFPFSKKKRGFPFWKTSLFHGINNFRE